MPWLSLFLFLVMCGIIFFQTIHGTFSALIMAVICVLGGTLALGLHETLAQELLLELIGDYAYPVAFAGIFAVSTLVLRLITDKFIARSLLLPSWIDRIGALGFGVVTGLIAAGVIGITVQMLPWGPAILGFERYDDQGKQHGLWLNPDKFTVNLCGFLADNTLSSGVTPGWRQVHPAFLTELHWQRDTESTGSRISVPAGSVTIKGVYETKSLYRYTSGTSTRRGGGAGEYEPQDNLPPDHRWVVVRATVDRGAADSDGMFRLSQHQVRLVGEDTQGIMQFPLAGIGPYDGRYVTADSMSLFGNKSGEFDFVFEVPAGPDFKHHFVEFKRAGQATIDRRLLADGSLETQTPTPTEPAAPAGDTSGSASSRRGGRTTPVRPQKKDTHIGNDLPMTIQRYAGTSVTLSGDGNALQQGSLVLYVDRQDPDLRSRRGDPPTHPVKTPLNSFSVPSGLHLLQLNVEAVHARSALGEALNLTRRVLQQYRILDRSGTAYWPAGLIAECDSDGDRIMEIQYFPEDADIRSQIRPFQQIRHQDLTGDYRFVLVFLLPPGIEITTFDAGRQEFDLSDLNLKTPS